jgi:WD40 repeat protein/uncharacterized protein YndB with AHSA1/START domain
MNRIRFDTSVRKSRATGAAAAVGMSCLAVAGAAAMEPRDSGRILRKEVVVDAGVDWVWQAWTTEAGIASFFSPDARIELRLGGAYELYMGMKQPDESGRRGSEGCRLLSFIPNEMLSFEWSFPPKVMSLRRADARTHVVLRFDPVDPGRTRIRFAQAGWKQGEDWDAGYAYFDRAWTNVLQQLRDKAKEEGKPDSPPPEGKSWTDGQVKVTALESPVKRQDFEMTLPVEVEKVWKLLATSKGLKRLGGKDPAVELRPGGRYSFWPGANNRVLSHLPNEMLSTSGSAPPKFPNVRRGGTWSAYFFDRVDDHTTRLRLTCVGWRPGEKEWDEAFDYFLKANAQFLNSVYDKLAGGARKDAAGRILRHEVIVAAPARDVWAAFTTKEGIESWMLPHAEIDLRVGGKMLTHYNPRGVIGDPDTIENTILSFEPERVFSIKATKPPASFKLKEAIRDMWTVVRLEPVGEGRTRVTCTGMGYHDDEGSRKLREHFEMGNAWTLRKLQAHFEKKSGAAGDAVADMPERPSLTPEFQSYLSHVAAASALLKLGEIAEARRWVDLAPPALRNWEWRYLNASLDQSARTWAGQDEAVMSVALSPDGMQVLEGLASGAALLRDARDGTLLRAFRGHEKALWGAVFSPDGKRLATSGADGVAKVWEVGTGRELLALQHGKTQVYSSAFSPDGRRLATSILSYVKIWDAENGEELMTLKGHVERPPVTRVAWSPDGRRLASASWDNHVIIWDAESGEAGHTLGPGYGGEEYAPFNAVAWSPSGSRLAACTGSKKVWLWNTADGRLIRKWQAHDKDIFDVAFDASGERLASGGVDQVLRVWSVDDGAELLALRGHTGSIRSVCFADGDTSVITGAADRSVKFWPVGGQRPEVVIRCGKGVWAAPFSPDGQVIATASSDRSARVWDARTGRSLAEFTGLPEQVARVSFSPDGRYLAAGSNDPVVRIWDWKQKELVHELKGHKGGVPTLQYSPDGTLLATTSYDKTIRIWDAASGRELRTIHPPMGYAYAIAFSPDGRQLASTDYDARVRLWDVATGSESLSLEGHRTRAMSVAFSPDGKKIAAAGYDHAIRVWELPGGRPVHALTGHGQEISGLAFSPDGQRLASCSGDQTVRLWDVTSGVEVATLLRDRENFYAVAFSPDGTRLSATLYDGRVMLLDTVPFAQRARAGSSGQ